MFNEVFSEKTAQVSLVSGVLFFILGSTNTSKMIANLVKKTLNISFTGIPLLVFNSVIFALLVGLLTYNVFRPLLGWDNTDGFDTPEDVMPPVPGDMGDDTGDVPCQDDVDCAGGEICEKPYAEPVDGFCRKVNP